MLALEESPPGRSEVALLGNGVGVVGEEEEV